jgi:nicotinamidase-related amidase
VCSSDLERVFAKTVNSAFITTNLHEHLQSLGVKDLVVCGLTTDHCVSTTVRMAANLGYNVTLPGDATATFNRKGKDGRHLSAEEVHEFALASLDGEFARVIETRELLGALSHAI